MSSNSNSPLMNFQSTEASAGSLDADPTTPSDTKAAFLRIPWTARMISQPGTVIRVPSSRQPKHDTEDSLFAEILQTSRTIRSCVAFYSKLALNEEHVSEVTTLVIVGDGMNGHPAILHGGITASLIDESMGIYLNVNSERAHLRKIELGQAEAEQPPVLGTAFTAKLTINYLRPVCTPGAIKITAKSVKREGRKEWLEAEVRQSMGSGEDGEEVVCATADALWIAPRTQKL